MKKFIVHDLVLDTSMTKTQIENMAQPLFDQKYGNGKVVFTYNLKRKNEVEMTFNRKMKYDVECDVLKDEDCVILSGLPIKNFQIELGKPTPLVIVLPYLSQYYVPIPDFTRLYSELIENIEGVKTKIEIISTENVLKASIKFR